MAKVNHTPLFRIVKRGRGPIKWYLGIVVRAIAITAIMFRLREAHKERRLKCLIHFLFLTFISPPISCARQSDHLRYE